MHSCSAKLHISSIFYVMFSVIHVQYFTVSVHFCTLRPNFEYLYRYSRIGRASQIRIIAFSIRYRGKQPSGRKLSRPLGFDGPSAGEMSPAVD